MTDREKAIKALEDIIATAEGIKGLSDDAGITISLDKIESLRFALDNLKTDASDKTDRGEVIATLTEHLDHWKRLLSEGICTKDEGEKTINALTFAIESIKVDRAYDLAYEKVDFIEIPEGATNGDMIKALFPECKAERTESGLWVNVQNLDGDSMFSAYWWNSPYRKEQE
jgi:hypothetical protein